MAGDASAPRSSGPACRTEAEKTSPGRRRLALVGVMGLVGGWLLFLIGLTAFTSNPVTINLRQVQAASAVVQLQVEDVGGGRCEVVKTLYGAQVPPRISLVNLDQTKAEPAEEYIVPVSVRRDGEFEVTSLHPSQQYPGVPPLLYPATPETFSQLSAAENRHLDR